VVVDACRTILSVYQR